MAHMWENWIILETSLNQKTISTETAAGLLQQCFLVSGFPPGLKQSLVVFSQSLPCFFGRELPQSRKFDPIILL